MPRLNTAGDVVAGIGGITGNVSVNGVVPAALSTAAAGSWGWYTSTVIAGPANFGSGYSTYTYNTATTTLTDLVTTGEFAEFNAGNSVYAGWKSTGVVTSVSGLGPFPTGGFADVSETGAIGIVVNRASDSGLRMYSSTGTLLSQWAVTLTYPSAVRMRGDVCAYGDSQGWWLRTISTGALIPYQQQTASLNAQVPITLTGGTLLVLERSTSGSNDTVVVRNAQTGQAWRIVSGGNQLYPDARELSTNVVRVALSVNSGESPAGLRLYDLNILTGALSRGQVSGGTIVWTSLGTAARVTVTTRAVGGLTAPTVGALQREPVADAKNGLRMTSPWYRWAEGISKAVNAPVNLANATGVLQPSNGGTGTSTGVTDVYVTQMQFSQTQVLAGRNSAGAGDGEEVTISQAIDWLGE